MGFLDQLPLLKSPLYYTLLINSTMSLNYTQYSTTSMKISNISYFYIHKNYANISNLPFSHWPSYFFQVFFLWTDNRKQGDLIIRNKKIKLFWIPRVQHHYWSVNGQWIFHNRQNLEGENTLLAHSLVFLSPWVLLFELGLRYYR